MKVSIYAPSLYIEMLNSEPGELNNIINGCGSTGAKFDFVPDSIYGLKITSACNIHDFMYFEGETLEDKKEADRVFLNNMLRIIEAKGGPFKFLRKMRARAYFQAVKFFGSGAFWAEKTPENMLEVIL